MTASTSPYCLRCLDEGDGCVPATTTALVAGMRDWLTIAVCEPCALWLDRESACTGERIDADALASEGGPYAIDLDRREK